MEGYVTNGASDICCYYLSCYFECRASAQAYFQSDSGMFGRICAAVSVWPDVFYPLGFNICLSLISAAAGWNEGHAGFRPTCLLWGLPPLFPPQFPLKDFSHFCASCCFGNRSQAGHMGASCGIPESLSGWILSYSTYRLFHTHLRYFYSSKLNSVTACHHFILLRWAETW